MIKNILSLSIVLLLLSCKDNQDLAKIKWNFKDYQKITYAYSQKMAAKTPFSSDSMWNGMEANLIVSIKNNELADIVLADVKTYSFDKDSLGNYIATDTVEMSNRILFQDLTPEGKMKGEIKQGNAMLAKTLFPIPNKPMAIGDTANLRMNMPFNIYGSSINAKGYNRIKYVEKKNDILHLKTKIDVSEYQIPEEINQDYICFLKGNSSFKFDSEKGVFEAGTINLSMGMGVNQVDSTSNSKEDKMMMEMNTKIDLKLKSIE